MRAKSHSVVQEIGFATAFQLPVRGAHPLVLTIPQRSHTSLLLDPPWIWAPAEVPAHMLPCLIANQRLVFGLSNELVASGNIHVV